MSIKSLPDDVRNTVRSAYSINNIVHCITELILNSLDANSNCVAVRVNLKTFRIQVIDNGDGISESDMTVVGVRYMTSKCHSKEDLEKKPKRHGFKGESLASIISISERVVITSKSKNTNSTFRKHFEKGNMKEITQEKDRSSYGTTVEIEGFMYNIKVRQARIKPTTNLETIKNIMECLAIINPDVSFSLRNDSTYKIIMSSNKSKTVVESLCSIHSQLSISQTDTRKVYRNKISVTGLFGKDLCKDTLQFLYVNKRPVSSQKIQKLIADLYTKYHSEYVFKENAHPVYVINIRCPYSEIDYNFDSAKTTVEFKQWHIIEKCIQKLIMNFLGVKKEQSKTEPKNSPKARKNFDNSGISQLEFAVKSKPVKRVLSSDKKSQAILKSQEKEDLSNDSDEFQPLPKIVLHENVVLSAKSDNTKTNSKEENDRANELFDKFFKKPNTKKNANRRKQKPKKKFKATDNNFNSLFFKHIKREKILPIADKTNENIQIAPGKSVFERHQNTQSLVSNTEIYADSKNVQNSHSEMVNDQNKGKEFMLDKFLVDIQKYVNEKEDTNKTNIENASTYSVVMTHKTFVQSMVGPKGFIMSIQNEDIRQSNAPENEGPMKLSKCIQTTFEIDAKLLSKYIQTKPSYPEKNNDKKLAISNFSKSVNTNDITISVDMWKQLKNFREEILEDNVFGKTVEEKSDGNFLRAFQNSMQTFLSHLNYNSHCNYDRCKRGFLNEKRNKPDKLENKMDENEIRKNKTLFKIPHNKNQKKFIIPKTNAKNFATKNRPNKFVFDETRNYTNKNKVETRDIFFRKNEKLQIARQLNKNFDLKTNSINEEPQIFFNRNEEGYNTGNFDSNLKYNFVKHENQNYFFQNVTRKQEDSHNIAFNKPIKRKFCLTEIELSPIKATDPNNCGKHYWLSPRKKTKHFEKDDGKNVTEMFEFSKYFLPIPKGQNKSTLFNKENFVSDNRNKHIFDFASVQQCEYSKNHLLQLKPSEQNWKLPENTTFAQLTNDFTTEEISKGGKKSTLNYRENLLDKTNFNYKNAVMFEPQNLNPEMTFKQCPIIHSKTKNFGNVQQCEFKNNLMQLKHCDENYFNSSHLTEKTISTPLINDFTVQESVVDLESSLNISNIMCFRQDHYRNHNSKMTDDTLSPTKTFRNECPASENSYNFFDCTVISNNFNFKKPSGTTTMSVFRTQNMETQTKNVEKEIHITCPESTNKVIKEKISLFDTGNDKCNDVGSKITNPNISCFTTNSNRTNGSEDFWVKKTDNFGSTFYINKKTGMTSFYTPKFENQFNVIKRLNFVPKGRSPMFLKKYKIDKSLSFEAKEKLKNAILECYSEELELCEKCIDTKNVKTFLSQIYKETANKFDNIIPSIQKNSYVSQNFTKDIFLQLEILGQVDLKYIAAIIQDQKLLLLFDQHAVHERVRVEDLYKKYRDNNKSNKLVFLKEICKQTILWAVSDSDMSLLKVHHKIFANFGLTFSTNRNYIKILTVPTCLMKKSLKKNADESNTLENLTKALVTEISDCLKVSGILMNIPKVIQNIINSEACRGAVKFGDKLDKENCVHLLKQLAKCNLPFQCAHGRPTLTPVIDLGENTCSSEVKRPNLKKLLQY